MRQLKRELGSVRRRYRRWKKRDRRPRSYGETKWAVCRDGDYFVVECPMCHSQRVWFRKKDQLFECVSNYKCRTMFSVYLEDGVRKMQDHRKGNLGFPARAVYDPGCEIYRLGIAMDAPWWWKRMVVYRDLHGGKDAHGHKEYRVVGVSCETQDEMQSEMPQA